MDRELAIKLADLGNAPAIVACILEHLNIKDPAIPLDRIAAAVGISQIERRPNLTCAGMLLTDPGRSSGVIALPACGDPRRERYTIGHEIGHFLLPNHDREAECTRDDLSFAKSSAREREANVFAAELLMPRRMFLHRLNAKRDLDIAHFEQLAKEFETSKEATARRIGELSEAPLAFVFSKDGRVTSKTFSRSMPYLNVRKDDRPPYLTAVSGAGSSVSEWAELGHAGWISTRDDAGGLWAQTEQLANGYAVTLLSFDPSTGDDEE
ncbi:MAG TPA: hypothetical protein DCL54_19575 [Alphaproteobacteria bacterium]|nr:hypothetical protein [Alphaproteobacteria bacterium]